MTSANEWIERAKMLRVAACLQEAISRDALLSAQCLRKSADDCDREAAKIAADNLPNSLSYDEKV
jgi:hypothetical protein